MKTLRQLSISSARIETSICLSVCVCVHGTRLKKDQTISRTLISERVRCLILDAPVTKMSTHSALLDSLLCIFIPNFVNLYVFCSFSYSFGLCDLLMLTAIKPIHNLHTGHLSWICVVITHTHTLSFSCAIKRQPSVLFLFVRNLMRDTQKIRFNNAFHIIIIIVVIM